MQSGSPAKRVTTELRKARFLCGTSVCSSSAPDRHSHCSPFSQNLRKRRRSDSEATSMAPKTTDSPSSETHPPRLPLRFVWQTDAEGRFSLATQEFPELIGPNTSAVLDRTWTEIAQTLKLDPQGQIAAAMAARQTFSGIVLHWPLDDSDDQMVVEMSGLPVFDREREFTGFRGFGICRDRRTAESGTSETASSSEDDPAAMVLPFPFEPRAHDPKLDAQEHS